MTQLFFPENPTNNQLYPSPVIAGLPQFRWNASSLTWIRVSTGQSTSNNVIFSGTTPIARADGSLLQEGDFWYNTATSLFSIYYSSQWSAINTP